MDRPVLPLFEHKPAPGASIEVAPGVHWLRLPLPLALDHINVWLLEDTDGWTVIDTGVATDATREAWEAVFATRLGGRPIVRVICTHMHPDHVGLADWMCRHWACPLGMTTGEYLSARVVAAGLPATDSEAQIDLFIRHGLAADQRIALGDRGNFYRRMVPAVPAHYQRISEAYPVRIGKHEWRVMVGTGHSPEHASLVCDALGIVISGDMLLPKISTNVSVWPIEPEANPLAWFLASIARYRELPADIRVLPSHGVPFTGAHVRVQELEAHHQARLAEVLEACAGTPKSAAEIVPTLFRRKLDIHQTSFALGEALAHLHHLWFTGDVVRHIDGHGAIRFGLP